MAHPTRKSAYYTDHWTLQDHLHFSDFRAALQDILLNAETPLTVGVFGAWGCGKTSLLQMLKTEIDKPRHPFIRTVWFTAWKYDRQEALWRAFVLRVLDALYPREDGDGPRERLPRLPDQKLSPEQKEPVAEPGRLEESVYHPVDWQELGKWTVDWWQLIRSGGKATAEIAATFIPGGGPFQKIAQAGGWR